MAAIPYRVVFMRLNYLDIDNTPHEESPEPRPFARSVTASVLAAAVLGTVLTVAGHGPGTARAAPCDSYPPGQIDRAAALFSSGTGSLPGSSASRKLPGAQGLWDRPGPMGPP